MILNVVTPCSRPENLARICTELSRFQTFEVHWFIGVEPRCYSQHPNPFDYLSLVRVGGEKVQIVAWPRSSPGTTGNPQRNEALEQIVDGWVIFLDDDTLPHPEFEAVASRAIAEHPEAQGFVFSQVDKEGRHRMRTSQNPPRSWLVGIGEGCDSGQMLFRRALIGDVRWEADHYDADHRFYRAVVGGRESLVRWVDEAASVHNALR